MKRTNIILFAISLFAFSCNVKDDVNPTSSSFSMTYNGVTYSEAEAASLNLVMGSIAAKGTDGDGFLLTIIGVGADGTTTNICTDDNCTHSCVVMLDFGAADGKEAFVANSGTVKRIGKKIEVNVSGTSTSTLKSKSLTATINVGTVLF